MLRKIKITGLLFSVIVSFLSCNSEGINRKELVERHTIEINRFDSLSPLSIGNGNFAFTVDFTGLQTFPKEFNKGIPLGTQSNWGWHSFPNTENYSLDQTYKSYQVGDKTVNYVHDYRDEIESERAKASAWLRANPHRMNLGSLGFVLLKSNGDTVSISEVENISQKLHLYSGKIDSYFEVEGIPVRVQTVCHPNSDVIAVRVSSELLKNKQLSINYQFNQIDNNWRNSITMLKDSNQIEVRQQSENELILKREVDDFAQNTHLLCKNGLIISKENSCIVTSINESEELELSCSFSTGKDSTKLNSFEVIENYSAKSWKEFWESGSAADFSNCTDPRAFELERRVVLSQYLTRIQCAGDIPPQETGLTFNSWHGKFHMEMHWWHGVHFALWNRPSILEQQIDYYFEILDKAKQTAKTQGYDGARWPKMTDLAGNESPSTIGSYLIWQQAHVIYLCNLLLENSDEKESILAKYKELIFETANFMADYPTYNSTENKFDLGPALIPAQERFRAENTINPTFELAYWHWGLVTAIQWFKELDEPVPEQWLHILSNLSSLANSDDLYLFTENATDSYTNETYLSDHPMVLGIVGMLPELDIVDKEVMRNTYQRIKKDWHWDDTWGWDFPIAAMTAAELGYYNDAIEFLLQEETSNTYLKNGHNFQNETLTIYLPGNGALLTAIARMCEKNQFPKDGTWKVKWEK
ncbi:MAG: hypothetical protein PF541_13030 [Prolixibacteraceae bacterium]|jgi:hypothetical protein|nr:hypothetical protein [Prolixibacteraceae bacterium]